MFMQSNKRKYSDEIIREAVDSSISMSETLRVLGMHPSGGSREHLKNRIKSANIDTSHFNSRGWVNTSGLVKKKNICDILVVMPSDSGKPKRPQLLRAMLESGMVYQCSCGLGPEWNERPLTLQIDHIDGDWRNNLLSNLRFLCPNCHTQQITSISWKNKSK